MYMRPLAGTLYPWGIITAMKKKEEMYTFLATFCIVISLSSQTKETQLLQTLLYSYSRFTHPLSHGNPVIVTFGFELTHIASVVESEQSITAKIWLRMSWYNELLKWNPNEWEEINHTRIASEFVWTPDIFLQEDISADMSSGPERYRTLILINSNGKNEWMIPVLLKSSCLFEVANFPFDHQSCTFTFTSWTRDENELKIQPDTRPIVTQNYINSSEWYLTNVSKEVTSTKYECCDTPFSDIKFTIQLHRESLYYICNMVAPCIIQMVIILFTFFIPPETGERIGALITVLLVFAVHLEVVSSTLPKSSVSIPTLSRFYVTVMAESALSIVATCLVLSIHFKGMEKGVAPIPCWARRCFIDGIAKYLFVQRGNHSDEAKCRRANGELFVSKRNESYTELNDEEAYQMCTSPTILTKSANVELSDYHLKGAEATVGAPEDLLLVSSLIQGMHNHNVIREEWQIVAKVLDRLFFLIFLVLFLVSSLVVLLPVSYIP